MLSSTLGSWMGEAFVKVKNKATLSISYFTTKIRDYFFVLEKKNFKTVIFIAKIVALFICPKKITKISKMEQESL